MALILHLEYVAAQKQIQSCLIRLLRVLCGSHQMQIVRGFHDAGKSPLAALES
jgi:hypothetical protein